MSVKNTLIKLLVAAAILLPAVGAAQTSSINAFSPYTMYGIGEQNTPGTLQMRSMGGAGVAVREAGLVNLLNPASYSVAPQKSFLFSFGLEGQNYYNDQTAEGVSKRSAYNTFNIHDIAIQMPLAKRLGLGVSLMPYSSVGYRTKFYNTPDDPILSAVGPVQYAYQGEGDVTEVKVGLGWEVIKNLSVGVAFQYFWGDIDRAYVMRPTSITGSGTYNSTVGTDNYSISSLKWQLGVQWTPILDQKRMLTVGAAFDFGGDIHPDVVSTIYNSDLNYTPVRDEESQLELVLPHRLTVGASYRTAKWAVSLDYTYQNWGGRNSGVVKTGADASGNSFNVAYNNVHQIKAGVEFTPNRYDVRRALRRWAYRAGLRYGGYNQSFSGNVPREFAVTAGIGIPVKFFSVSKIDLGVEYGMRGFNLSKSLGLVSQQYFKFAVGFSLFAGGAENNDYWFTRPKYD